MSFKKFLSQRFSLAIAVGLFFASLAILWWVLGSPGITTIGENVSVGGQLTVSGNVGIGTSSPGQKIHIYGSSGSQRIRIESAGTSSNDQASLQLVAGNNSWISWVSGDSDQLRFFSSSLNSNVMTLTSAGNVGIGTTGPTEKLDVVGAIYSRPSPYNYGNLFVVDSAGNKKLAVGVSAVAGLENSTILQSAGGGIVLRSSDGSVRIRLTETGNVGIGTTGPAYKLDIAGALRLQPSSAPTGANGVIYYDSTENKFKCYQNGAWVDCIGAGGGGYWAASGTNIYNTNTGNVGIGTTNPTAKLHVVGGGIKVRNTTIADSGIEILREDHELAMNSSGGSSYIDVGATWTKITRTFYFTYEHTTPLPGATRRYKISIRSANNCIPPEGDVSKYRLYYTWAGQPDNVEYNGNLYWGNLDEGGWDTFTLTHPPNSNPSGGNGYVEVQAYASGCTNRVYNAHLLIYDVIQ
jgi:hypothetical protein